MQHNKNSDANVEIRCEAQATKRGGKRNWKSPRVGYREGKKILGNTAQFPPCGLSPAPAAAARHLRCQNAR